jgi:phosphatidylglycerol---prolipoprotein diacylglyceryl transferase
MYPFINVGPLHLGTFGLFLWLAAVAGGIVLHRNFLRNGVDADALNVVTLVTVAGVLGAKTWHELQDVPALVEAMRQIALPGWSHPFEVLFGFLRYFQSGVAWFGGLLAGIATLMWQGRQARPDGMSGWWASVRMLDLAAPAAAIGYGIGRIGCLTSGDGDYGKNTTLPWGVHMARNALVPPTPPDALVQPTPIYEFLFALVIGWLLWRLGRKALPLGWLTGLYLVLSGIGRFLVEFVRINPKLYFGMSNAQTAALGSVVVGVVVMIWASKKDVKVAPPMEIEAVAAS